MAARKGPILIVDDDLDVREALRDALEDEGYTVVLAGDGRAALEHLRSSAPPVLVMLDWLMPGMEGPEVHAAIRKEPSLAQVPIVMLTADPRMRTQAREMGATDFLDKPLDLERLLSVVARYAG